MARRNDFETKGKGGAEAGEEGGRRAEEGSRKTGAEKASRRRETEQKGCGEDEDQGGGQGETGGEETGEIRQARRDVGVAIRVLADAQTLRRVRRRWVRHRGFRHLTRPRLGVVRRRPRVAPQARSPSRRAPRSSRVRQAQTKRPLGRRHRHRRRQ